MGQKDLTEKNLEYYPDVFADIVNALLYPGNQVVNAKELLPAPTETMYYSQRGKLRNQFHDVSKIATKHGVTQIQYTLENETKASRKMIFRRIGYEGAVYREQLDSRSDYPFVGLVLYWGRGKWKQPRSVAEYFSSRELPLETWKYINDFHLQVFSMATLPADVRKRFSSDMRIIVDYLAEGKEYKPSDQKILHMEAFLLLMRNLTGDVRYEELWDELAEDIREGGEITMCELLDKYWNGGIKEGAQQGEARMLIKAVDSLMVNLAFSLQQACESIGTTVEEYQLARQIKHTK